MRKANFKHFVAGLLSALMCCGSLVSTAFAVDTSPLYGITATDGSSLEISELNDETALEKISSEAKMLNYGATYEMDQYYNATINPGHLVSPFFMKASSSDGTVSFTMDKPTNLGFDSELIVFFGEAYMIAVQDVSAPDSPVMFYPAEIEGNSLAIEIPVWDSGANCALLYCADSSKPFSPRSFTTETNTVNSVSDVFENSQGSAIPFQWTVKMKSQSSQQLLPSGLYAKILLKASSDLTLVADSVKVSSSFLEVKGIQQKQDGSLLVELEC